MTDLDDLKTYLGQTADQWDDDALQAALNAESADQAGRCRIPDPRPASLSEALWRRVAHNLAVRALPLGIAQGEVDSVRVSVRDPEVRRLEAPYRKLVVG